MSDKGIFSDRERALEDTYFRQQDARLIEQLRQYAGLDEIARALADKLHIDNPELLARARELGITAETAPAFFLAPLVQVAWAIGAPSRREREAVLRLAHERGVEDGSAAADQLSKWLKDRPSEELFDTALEALRYGYSVLPPDERDERVQRVLNACYKVAESRGTDIGRQFGIGDGVSPVEKSLLDRINYKLRY